MKHIAEGDRIAPNLATDCEFDDEPFQSIETALPTVVAPTTAPHLTPEVAAVLARIIQAMTRDTRHHRAA